MTKKTYAQIQQQIEQLQREAEALRRNEVDDVIARIKEAIRAYGISAADLGLAAKRGPKPVKAGPTRRGRRGRPAKFGDGAGNTWSGRGPRPKWLREALAAGKQLSDFAV